MLSRLCRPSLRRLCARALPLAAWLMLTEAHAHCFEAAGSRHGVNPQLLRAIAQVESSGNSRAVNTNRGFRTHNEDIGLMQINSVWLPELAQFGIRREHLFDPCLNVHIGAWILARQIKRYGNTWKAVGAYHSVTPGLNERYAWRVFEHLRKTGEVAHAASRR